MDRTADGSGWDGVGAFLLSGATVSGLARAGAEVAIGLRAAALHRLSFDDSEARPLGGPRGVDYRRLATRALAGSAAAAVGVARAAGRPWVPKALLDSRDCGLVYALNFRRSSGIAAHDSIVAHIPVVQGSGTEVAIRHPEAPGEFRRLGATASKSGKPAGLGSQRSPTPSRSVPNRPQESARRRRSRRLQRTSPGRGCEGGTYGNIYVF